MRQTRADRDGVLPVLLLHGWTWSLDVNFFGLMPPLSQRHPIVGLDQRGHGRGLPIAGEFSIADCAEDVIAVLDVLNIDRVIVCGFSLGGLVGTHMALAHPQRVAGLVLAACALNYRQNRRDRLLWTALATAAPLARLNRGNSLPARYFGANRRSGTDVVNRWPWLHAELTRTPLAAVLAIGRAVQRHDLRGRVQPLRNVPSVVLLTDNDTLCRPALQRQLADQLGAHVIPVAADHDFPVVHPDLFAAAVLDAVARVNARVSGA
ncbi:hypothetical protein FrCorBMG51_04000 [Protofrankia coriariae]|uniref:AB hydrolase-1 domain-containing protein n=1 Tax=Protofrankia coriariae TaxID=1562887 RepID=A0ABR5F6W3_9ACTN|nr:hypothetical protein FrCorBMG51_04000 [Protofrankia coriariae]